MAWPLAEGCPAFVMCLITAARRDGCPGQAAALRGQQPGACPA